MENGLPMLGADTLQSRATASGQIWEARQRARRQVTDEFETVDDPDRVPIRRRGEGFGAGQGFLDRQRPREAAARLDDQYPEQDVGPGDVRETAQGFGLNMGARREAAARDLDAQYPAVDLGVNDVTQQEGGGFGLTPGAEREVAAERIEDTTPLGEVLPGDVRRTEGGQFELRDSVIEQNRGLFR